MVSVAIIYIAVIGTTIIDRLIEYSSSNYSMESVTTGVTVRVRVKGKG